MRNAASTLTARSRIRWGIVAVISSAALVVAACGEDAQHAADEAVTEEGAAQDAEDEGDAAPEDEEAAAEEPLGDGDPDASTVTVDGEDVDLHFTECQEQFDNDGVEMRVRGADPFSPDHDPELELVLSVDEHPTEDGAWVELRRGPLELEDDFDGHRWELDDNSEVEDIGWHGASADVELELTEMGADEPSGESGDMEIVTFDIVC